MGMVHKTITMMTERDSTVTTETHALAMVMLRRWGSTMVSPTAGSF